MTQPIKWVIPTMYVLLCFNRLFGLMSSSNIPTVTNIPLQELNRVSN